MRANISKSARIMTDEAGIYTKVGRQLYTSLANNSPDGLQSVRAVFAQLRENHSQMVLSGTAPEFSDLVAAEYQAALDNLLRFIEDGFQKPIVSSE